MFKFTGDTYKDAGIIKDTGISEKTFFGGYDIIAELQNGEVASIMTIKFYRASGDGIRCKIFVRIPNCYYNSGIGFTKNNGYGSRNNMEFSLRKALISIGENEAIKTLGEWDGTNKVMTTLKESLSQHKEIKKVLFINEIFGENFHSSSIL